MSLDGEAVAVRLVLVILLAALAAGLLWFLLDDSGSSGTPDGHELTAPEGDESDEERVPDDVPSEPRVTDVPVTMIDELPQGILEHLEAGGQSLLDDPEFMERIVRFEVDPKNPHKRLTGEIILAALSDMPGIGKQFRFLSDSDMKRFRAHRFQAVVEPRMTAGMLISFCPLLGYRAVAWEGEFYMVPIPNHFVEDSAPIEGTAADKRTKSQKVRDRRAREGQGTGGN